METTGDVKSEQERTILTPKFDWYQTDTYVVVTVMVKGVKKDEVSAEYGEKSLSVSIDKESGEAYKLRLTLSHPVKPQSCTTRVMSTKIECKLIKEEGIRWNLLQGEDNTPAASMNATSSHEDAHRYPSSAHYTRDWDKMVADIKEEEANEKPEGDAAVNSLFQKIYKDGDENIKKAMNKSFVESGGTVLSTNWSEIGNKTTELKAPDGMEYKKYEI